MRFALLILCCLASAVRAGPDDPYASSTGAWAQDFADQWALVDQRIYADIAPSRVGEKVLVAVIDTGLDYTHEDISGEQIWRNTKEEKNGRDDDGNGYVDDLIGWNFVDNNNNPLDESGHGTHIAGVIAACTNNGLGIAAVNSDAVIMPLKVANFAGQARSTAVAAAIYYAVDQGARLINLSLGSELVTGLEQDAARYAAEQGVLIVVSAGNRGLPTEQHGYAGLPGALVVGALAPDHQRAGFSNFGGNLALLAPGVDILSLRARGSDFIALSDPLDYEPGTAVVGESEQYYRATGTSFAAAVATGVASKLLSLRPELSSTELQRVMVQSAQDIEPPGLDQLSGHGNLNYLGALGADPARAVAVRLSGATLALEEKQLWVDVQGVFEASDFSQAVLYMRPLAESIPKALEPADGKKRSKKKKKKRKQDLDEPDPYRWQQLAQYDQPHTGGAIARLAVDELTRLASGSTQWELKLTVNDQYEAFISLSLPQPEVFLEEEAEDDD